MATQEKLRDRAIEFMDWRRISVTTRATLVVMWLLPVALVFAQRPLNIARLPAIDQRQSLFVKPPLRSIAQRQPQVDKSPSLSNSQQPEQPHGLQSSIQAEKPTRTITLYEAILGALENNGLIRTLDGGVRIESTSRFDPEINAQSIESADAKFDPAFSGEYLRSRINEPPASFFGPGIGTETRRNEVDFSAKFEKQWAAGTTTGVGYEPPLAYLFFPQGVGSSFNPLYSTDLVFNLRQPLLKGYGADANLAEVRITHKQYGKSLREVEEAIQAQLRSIEQAYWQLHAARVSLKAIDQAIPLAEKNVEIEYFRFQEERVTYADVARASVKLEDLKQQRTRAAFFVKQNDYRLRQLIGLRLDAGGDLLPIDSPVSMPPMFEVDEIVAMAIRRRPDLQRRRLNVAIRDDFVSLARSDRLPEIDAQAQYRASGLSERLSGALEQTGDFNYTDWTVGFTFSVPLGNRDGNARYRAAELEAARERALLKGYEDQVAFELADLVAEVQAVYERFQSAMQQVEHAQKWLKLSRIRYETPPVRSRTSDSLLLALYDYQLAIQANVNATQTAAETLAEYNTGLARIEEARGTMLDRWRVRSAMHDGLPAGLE